MSDNLHSSTGRRDESRRCRWWVRWRKTLESLLVTFCRLLTLTRWDGGIARRFDDKISASHASHLHRLRLWFNGQINVTFSSDKTAANAVSVRTETSSLRDRSVCFILFYFIWHFVVHDIECNMLLNSTLWKTFC